MYEQYWQLKEKPFENTPDPRFMYYSKKHEQALIRMLYAVKESKGAALLTGEYGSGKTLLSRIIIGELIQDKMYEVALITNPGLAPIQLIQELVYQLGGSSASAEKPELLHQLQEIIYRNFQQAKKTIIIVDEAQLIKDVETFEELRLLLNFQLDNKFLLTILLIGQPELVKKVNQIPQLEQRMSVKFHLGPLNRAESDEYIQRRLAIAGRNQPIFAQAALELIYDYTRGIPRKMNNICDVALLLGSMQNIREVDREVIQDVIADLTQEAGVYA